MEEKIAGVDEAGRGPLAGPLYAAAVILKRPIPGLADSKVLSPLKREKLEIIIQEEALSFGYGIVLPSEIDTLNIHHATLLAMTRAIQNLNILPDRIRIDGRFVPKDIGITAEAHVKGDSLFPEISAASILAKVARDREMLKYHEEYPEYGFINHKGYPTKEHMEAIQRFGPTPIHRLSFAPLNKLTEKLS